MANPANITLRQEIERALTYEEVDDNFQELASLIDEYNLFILGYEPTVASEIDYIPQTGGLIANNIQDAIDELAARIDAIEGTI